MRSANHRRHWVASIRNAACRLPTLGCLRRAAGYRLVRVPLWIIVSVLVVAAAAGQAVGPVLSGTITGQAPVTVSQAVLLDLTAPFGRNPGFGDQDDTLGESNEPNDGASTRSEDGTSFTVAIEVVVGQRAHVNIYLQNTSGAPAAAQLELNVPRGIDVELADIDKTAEGGSNVNATGGAITSNVVREARINATTWLLSVNTDAGNGDDDGVTLIIRPRGDVAPGFYPLTGRITQFRG